MNPVKQTVAPTAGHDHRPKHDHRLKGETRKLLLHALALPLPAPALFTLRKRSS